jgi:hypothetical protein
MQKWIFFLLLGCLSFKVLSKQSKLLDCKAVAEFVMICLQTIPLQNFLQLCIPSPFSPKAFFPGFVFYANYCKNRVKYQQSNRNQQQNKH